MVVDDYSFNMNSKINPGKRTMLVENTASQPHEFLLVKLKEGKNGGRVLNWLDQAINSKSRELPEAPGEFLNGVSPREKEVVNYITVDLEPGEYCLICPYPDKDDGKPHFMHGMVKQFSVGKEQT